MQKETDLYLFLQNLSKFEESIGVHFNHIRLLARAFTDRSIGFNNLTLGSNQRLEFLGDTVLQLVASEYLYKYFPEHHEGHLSVSANRPGICILGSCSYCTVIAFFVLCQYVILCLLSVFYLSFSFCILVFVLCIPCFVLFVVYFLFFVCISSLVLYISLFDLCLYFILFFLTPFPTGVIIKRQLGKCPCLVLICAVIK